MAATSLLAAGLAASACQVYDESLLLEGSPTASAGDAGNGGQAGSASGGMPSDMAGTAGDSPTQAGSSGGGSGGSAGMAEAGAGAGGAAGEGGAPAEPDGGMMTTEPAQVLVVSDSFFVGGRMGDAALGAAVVAWDTSNCFTPRPDAADGDCYHFTYHTPMATGEGWGGVVWQYPLMNWGSSQGLAVPAGASRVTFYAAANMDGASVLFQVGRIQDAMLDYQDTVDAAKVANLTTEMQRFEIPLTQATYTEVIGGFGWTFGVGTDVLPDGYEFYIDKIRWEWDVAPAN